MLLNSCDENRGPHTEINCLQRPHVSPVSCDVELGEPTVWLPTTAEPEER